METERQFVEGGVAVPAAEPIGPQSIVNSMIASNAIDKRTMDDRAVGPRELDLDFTTIAAGEVLSFRLDNGVMVLDAVPTSNIGGVVPADGSVTREKINTGTDTPAAGEFLQFTAAGLRWSAIPRQTDITAEEIADGVIPTIPTALPPTDGSVTNASVADDAAIAQSKLADITTDDLPTIPQSKLNLSLTTSDLPDDIPASKLAAGVIPTIPTNLPPTASSVLPSMINAGGTAEAGKILKLTSATAWGWADDNANSGGGAVPNESVTEAKLDAHNDPTSGYALKWDTTNGLYWGEDENTTYTIPTQLPPTDGSVTYAKLSATDATSGQVLTYDGTGLSWSDKSDTTIPDDSIAEVKLDIHNAPTSGQRLAYTANGMEWVDAPTIPTELPPTDDSVDNDSFANDLVIASKHIPTISYTDLSDRPTIPTALPPTNDSVGEAAINATDTPSNGEFLQVSIDNNGNRTLNWSTALTSIASGSIGEGLLSIHNNPSSGKVLGYTANGLEWVDDEDTTYTLNDLVNGTPSDDQVVTWDNTNSRPQWSDAPSPTLQSLVNGTPTADQVVAWDATNSRATWADGGSGGGVSPANLDLGGATWAVTTTLVASGTRTGVPSSGTITGDGPVIARVGRRNIKTYAFPAGADAMWTAGSVIEPPTQLHSGSIQSGLVVREPGSSGRIFIPVMYDPLDDDMVAFRLVSNDWVPMSSSELAQSIYAGITATAQPPNLDGANLLSRDAGGVERLAAGNAAHLMPRSPIIFHTFSANPLRVGYVWLAWNNSASRTDVYRSTLTYSLPDGSVSGDSLVVPAAPTDDQVLAWDATNSQLYWKDDHGAADTQIFSAAGLAAQSSSLTTRSLHTGRRFSDYSSIYFTYHFGNIEINPTRISPTYRTEHLALGSGLRIPVLHRDSGAFYEAYLTRTGDTTFTWSGTSTSMRLYRIYGVS